VLDVGLLGFVQVHLEQAGRQTDQAERTETRDSQVIHIKIMME